MYTKSIHSLTTSKWLQLTPRRRVAIVLGTSFILAGASLLGHYCAGEESGIVQWAAPASLGVILGVVLYCWNKRVPKWTPIFKIVARDEEHYLAFKKAWEEACRTTPSLRRAKIMFSKNKEILCGYSKGELLAFARFNQLGLRKFFISGYVYHPPQGLDKGAEVAHSGHSRVPWYTSSIFDSEIAGLRVEGLEDREATYKAAISEAQQGLKAFVSSSGETSLAKPSDSFIEWVSAVFKDHEGLIIGETHGHHFPIQYLTLNMHTFREVDTLFLEHLCITMQDDLDHYHNTGEMTPVLEAYLRYIDQCCGRTSAEYNYLNLVISAQKSGKRVVALDKDAISGRLGTDLQQQSDRCRAFNHVASQVIAREKSRGGKYIVLAGAAHAVVYHHVPGLRQILNQPVCIIGDGGGYSSFRCGTESAFWAQHGIQAFVDAELLT